MIVPSDILELLKCAVDGNIEEYDTESETNSKGQGFVGEIIFITLYHKTSGKKKDVIVKQEQNGDGKALELFDALFNVEIKFYDKVWPFLSKYYKNVTGKEVNLIAKCFGTSSIGRKRIVLENIKSQGFDLYDKTKPFDDDHMRFIFKTYGIYHGISMAFRYIDREQYNELVNHESNFFMLAYEDDSPFSKDFIGKIQGIKEYFDPVQEKEILEKLSLYETSGPALLREVVKADLTNGVIIHGDCWSNNLMFKYNDQGKVQAIKLLDFQLMCHGSPIFDLSYCFYSGACEETLNKLDDYLEIYHQSLTATLKAFDLDADTVYPFKTFKSEWKNFCKYGFPLALGLWRIKLIDQNEIPDFSKDMEDVTIKISKHFEDDYRSRIRELVFHLHSNNFI